MAEDIATLHDITDGGVVGQRVVSEPLPMRVAPTTTNKHNTIRSAVVPFACWRANDMRFEFESSFVKPDIATEMVSLNDLIERHTVAGTADGQGPALSVFGHADPTGDDDFNKLLSGRRAQVIYAMLVRRVDLWEDLYSNPLGNDRWEPKAINTMQTALGRPVSNHPSAAARKILFKDYMDLVCAVTDDEGNPVLDGAGQPKVLLLKATDFLANGSDAGGKGDFQGCGELNPVLLFSDQETKTFAAAAQKPARDAQNAPNRRVVIYMFRPGVRIEAAKWPCPRVKEGVGGCKKRFFSDGEARRSAHLPAARRKYEDTLDTFGCRFYDRLSNASPCEQIPIGHGAFFMQCLSGDGQTVLANRSYVIRSQTNPTIRFQGVLDAEGKLSHEGVPPNDYLLFVQGCGENTPIAVLRPGIDGFQIRMLENARVGVRVLGPDGNPAVSASVTLDGAGELVTDDDGLAYFNSTSQGQLSFSVTAGVTLTAASFTSGSSASLVSTPAAPVAPSPPATARGTVNVGNVRSDVVVTLTGGQPAVVPTLVRIDARQNVTDDLRTAFSPNNTPSSPFSLPPSTSSDPDMTKNPAVVVIRGSRSVFLTAVTNPPGELVIWDVVQNQSTNSLPTLSPLQTVGNFSVQLSTDTTGSFFVRAKLGASVLVWNVIIVGVDLDPATPQPVVRQTGLTDLNTFLATAAGKKTVGLGVDQTFDPTKQSGVASGTFTFGSHAFSSVVSVTLTGGGPGNNLGCNKVSVQLLQNMTDDRVAADYDTQIAITDNVSPVAYPLLDTSGGSPPGYAGPSIGVVIINGVPVTQTPFLHSPGMLRTVTNTPTARTFEIGDSPAVGFSTRQGSENVAVIRGDQRFRVALVSFSQDAVNEIVAHADLRWSVDYTGDVAVSTGIGHWTARGANVSVTQGWTPITSGSVSGTDAMNALLETKKPLSITLQNVPKKIIPKP